MLPYSERGEFQKLTPVPEEDPELDYFFSHAYHDMRFFLKSITKSNSSTYTYFGDMQKNLFYISDNMRDTFGFDSNVVEDLLGKWRDRIYGDKWKALYDRDRKNILETKSDTHDLRYQVRDKKGKIFWIRCYGSMQWDKSRTTPLFFAGRVAKQDDHFAVDPLTNFPTEDTLQYRLDQLSDYDYDCMMIGFSLNHVTQINTMYGRSVGDRLIENVSKALMDNLTGKMSFYRLSGIRCLAIVDRDVKESREDLILEIRDIAEKVYQQMDVPVSRPCSFAIMRFPQPGVCAKDLLENMISLIKLAGDEPDVLYVENSQKNEEKVLEASQLQMTLAQDVLNGMRNFRPVIQLVVSAETGKIMAGETLMRWKYHGKDVSPGVFVPILEKDRLIFKAGRWVIEQAVEACTHIVKYLPDFYLTVNVSLEQLYDEGLAEFIPEVLDRYHLDGRHLVVEMTESTMDKEPGRLRALIDACHQRDVQLALDDFGTGYSSLRVLMHYNTNIIKIDRSLLLEMTESESKSNFISSIVYACHQFGKKVCMEGVETEQHIELVRSAQCDLIQGFYYFRPDDLPAVYEHVRKQAEG